MSELHNWDDIDVPAALARKTADGSGFQDEEELPLSDFVQEDEADK